MRHVLRTAIAGLALCLAPVILSAHAQTVAQAQIQCTDSAGVGAYHRCALWLDGNVVRRGSAGDIVARPGFIRPMPLTRLVSGDSARAQATRYELNARRSNVLGAAAALVFVAAYVVADSYDCAPVEFGFCGNSDDGHTFAAAALAIGSSLTLLASVPFAIRARRASARAIWWNNARFAH